MSELFALGLPDGRAGLDNLEFPFEPLLRPPPGSLNLFTGILFFASLVKLDMLGSPNSSSSILSLVMKSGSPSSSSSSLSSAVFHS